MCNQSEQIAPHNRGVKRKVIISQTGQAAGWVVISTSPGHEVFTVAQGFSLQAAPIHFDVKVPLTFIVWPLPVTTVCTDPLTFSESMASRRILESDWACSSLQTSSISILLL